VRRTLNDAESAASGRAVDSLLNYEVAVVAEQAAVCRRDGVFASCITAWCLVLAMACWGFVYEVAVRRCVPCLGAVMPFHFRVRGGRQS